MKLSALLAFSIAAAVRTEGCTESAVRLEGLGSREVGRVQICEWGDWKDACSSSETGRWRESNAVVLCRELGFSNGATTDRLAVSPGSSNSSSRAITCTGLETSVADCHTNQTTTNCQGPPPIVMCINSQGEGSVRLIHIGDERGGETSGVVEVYMGSEWVGVCTDDWSKEDSGVICRQLGYSTGTPTFTKPHASVIRKLPQQRINYVRCSGSEVSLTACSFTLYSSECRTATYASVNCSPDSASAQEPSQDECSSVSLDVIMSFGAVQLVVMGLAVLLNVVILVAWSRWRRHKVSQTTPPPPARGGRGFVCPPSYSDVNRDTLLETGAVDNMHTRTNMDTHTSHN